ncbi:MAG: bifunctional serine/threonine-protein kinase/formylglycine-generating enzyme family protein [Ardenticatenaceae bacterium]
MFNTLPTGFRHYEVLELLGGGAFGFVYLARDTHLRRLVALKMLHTHLAAEPDTVQRFLREARAMASLDHLNIVRVNRVDASRDSQLYFFEMEYVEGQTLADYRAGRVLPLQEAIPILKQMAAALDAAHQQGIVHRDVKPENVLIKPNRQLKLTDFGIIKHLQPTATGPISTHGVAGTPTHIAPEQADEKRKHEIGPASDIYALGVVGYELFTGRLPFERSNYHALLAAHAIQAPPDPRTFNRNLPAPVADVLLKVLAKQPRDRYPSAMAFVEALEQAGKSGVAPRTDLLGGLAATIRHLFAKPSAVVWPIVVALAMLMIVALGWGLAVQLAEAVASRPPTITPPAATQTAATPPAAVSPAATPTAAPPELTATPPAATPTAAPPELTATPILGIGSTRLGQDGMTLLYVPEGESIIGSKEDDPAAHKDKREHPQHEVYLNPFWIDKTEVTNEMFAAFLNAIGNQEEEGAAWLDIGNSLISESGGTFQPKAGFADHPAVEVTWYGANAYCQWAGRRLPTEAEWEKAARGTDIRNYPWGNNPPTKDVVNFNFNVRYTTAVGTYPDGASPYGALNMGGNVSEWVADWYDRQYYEESPQNNPNGPIEGKLKALRGGSWFNNLEPEIRAACRGADAPAVSEDFLGFRCGLSHTP